MSLCPICRSRKGKRACPAKGATICSVCCGEKRIVEIACPDDCVYLGAGVQNDLRREALDYIQHQDPRKGMRWIEAIDRLGLLFEVIEQTIATSSIPSLEDAELLVALESARRTFESETKGIIYDDLPDSPTLQALTRELVTRIRVLFRTIDEQRKDLALEGPALPVLGPDAAVECFSVMSERCEYHIKRKRDAGSLVGHLRRVRPRRARPDAEAPRILLA